MGRVPKAAPLNLCCAAGAAREPMTIRWIRMFALRSVAEAVAVRPLDLVLLRVAEPAADPAGHFDASAPAWR